MTITVLEGSTGQELGACSGDVPTPLWATGVMLDHPYLVRAIHDDYFRAGATIATTSTDAVHHHRLQRDGLDDRFADLHQSAVAAAQAARKAHGSGRIAGSKGPLVASCHTDVVLPVAEAAPRNAEMAAVLGPHDGLIRLTPIASAMRAEGALTGAAAGSRPVWSSVTVDDRDGSRLRSGEPLASLGATMVGGCCEVGPAHVWALASVLVAAGHEVV